MSLLLCWCVSQPQTVPSLSLQLSLYPVSVSQRIQFLFSAMATTVTVPACGDDILLLVGATVPPCQQVLPSTLQFSGLRFSQIETLAKVSRVLLPHGLTAIPAMFVLLTERDLTRCFKGFSGSVHCASSWLIIGCQRVG